MTPLLPTNYRFQPFHLLGDSLHLLTSAFWPGALAPLAAFLLLLLKSSQVEAIVLAAPVVRRFSASSLIAVAGMAFTGLLNSHFYGRKFSGTPDKYLWAVTSF